MNDRVWNARVPAGGRARCALRGSVAQEFGQAGLVSFSARSLPDRDRESYASAPCGCWASMWTVRRLLTLEPASRIIFPSYLKTSARYSGFGAAHERGQERIMIRCP